MPVEIIFTFRNTHDAVSGEQALIRAGVPVKVIPIPGKISAGCGLCLRVPPEQQEKSKDALHDSGIAIDAIYTTDNGAYTLVGAC